MQYASVLIKQRLNRDKALTYAIPPAILSKLTFGCVVEVPFRNRVTFGIVTGFVKRISGKYLPKNILRIVHEKPVISQEHLKLFQDVAQLAIASSSDALFHFIPPLLINFECNLTPRRIKGKRGGFRYVCGTVLERFLAYKRLIQNFSGSLIFLFPDQIILKQFANFIRSDNPNIILSTQSPRNRWKDWENVNNNIKLVLTLRSGISILPPRPAIIVVDNPDNPGFKEQRRPKYQINELLTLRMEYGDSVVLGLERASILQRTLFGASKSVALPPILLTKSNEILPTATIDRIKNRNRILIAIPNKNEWGLLVCKDCHSIYRCQNCGKPLKQLSINNIRCVACLAKSPDNFMCNHCKGTSIKRYGIGTAGIKKIINNLLPQKTVFVCEKSTETNNDLNNFNIIIATHQIFDYHIKKFDYVVCLGFDPLIDIPLPLQEEHVLLALTKFIQLGQRAEIITQRPAHRIYHALANNKVDNLLDTIKLERSINLPPFSRLVLLSSKHQLTESFFKDFPGILLNQQLDKLNNKYLLSIQRKNWYSASNWLSSLPIYIKIDPDPLEYS